MATGIKLIKWYNPYFITLSWIVSFLGSFTTLVLLQQLPFTKNRFFKFVWIFFASLCLGICAVWSMHFTGMVAFQLTKEDGTLVPIRYELLETIFSLLIAMIGSLLAFSITSVHDLVGFRNLGQLLGRWKSPIAHLSQNSVIPSTPIQKYEVTQTPRSDDNVSIYDDLRDKMITTMKVHRSATMQLLASKESTDTPDQENNKSFRIDIKKSFFKSKDKGPKKESRLEKVLLKNSKFEIVRPNIVQIIIGGIFLAAAATGMHYLGMKSQRIPGTMVHDGWLVALSCLIALITGTAGLILSYCFNKSFFQVISAAVMATAICAMHYTGMQSSDYYFIPELENTYDQGIILIPGDVAFTIGTFVTLVFSFVLVGLVTYIISRERISLFRQLDVEYGKLEREKEVSDLILLNILPESISCRLKNGETIIDMVVDASILFADIVGFTRLSSRISASSLVQMLNELFCLFDDLLQKGKMEKIKSIGDCYMVACGLPLENPRHCHDACAFGIAMINVIKKYNKLRNSNLEIRVGISSGQVIAAIIGRMKFCYDVWGDTVNTASRMESNGIAMTITVSQKSYELVKDVYGFVQRPEIEVKGKGKMTIYSMDPLPKVEFPDSFFRSLESNEQLPYSPIPPPDSQLGD